MSDAAGELVVTEPGVPEERDEGGGGGSGDEGGDGGSGDEGGVDGGAAAAAAAAGAAASAAAGGAGGVGDSRGGGAAAAREPDEWPDDDVWSPFFAAKHGLVARLKSYTAERLGAVDAVRVVPRGLVARGV